MVWVINATSWQFFLSGNSPVKTAQDAVDGSRPGVDGREVENTRMLPPSSA
jgi:hypothetical protein